MKAFIKKAVLFLAVFLVFLVFNTGFNYLAIRHKGSGLPACSTLIMGDSHAVMTIDPESFSNASNVAQFAEPLVITYWKLKSLAKEHKPDTVVLSIGTHNFSSLNDDKLTTGTAFSFFEKCYPVAKPFELDRMLSVNLDAYYKALIRHIALYPHLNHDAYLGSFEPRAARGDVLDAREAIKRHYYTGEVQRGVSNAALVYTDSIISYCQQEAIVLVAVSTPLHPKYLQSVPADFLDAFDSSMQAMEDQGVIVIDMRQSGYEEALFYDTDHLNRQGARIFSAALGKRLGR